MPSIEAKQQPTIKLPFSAIVVRRENAKASIEDAGHLKQGSVIAEEANDSISFCGTIVDWQDGTPIMQEAKVEVIDAGGIVIGEALAINGYFHIGLDPREKSRTFVARADGYETAMGAFSFSCKEGGSISVPLRREGLIVVRLTGPSAYSSVPIISATVELEDLAKDPGSLAWGKWELDSRLVGNAFHVLGVPGGEVVAITAMVVNDNGVELRGAAEVVALPGEVSEVEIELCALQSVSVKVVDDESIPIANAELECMPNDAGTRDYMLDQPRVIVTTDGNGEFLADDLMSGSWSVIPRGEGKSSHLKGNLLVRPNSVDQFLVVMSRSLSISGYVEDCFGAPTSAIVHARSVMDGAGTSVRSKRDGSFLLVGLANARYRVGAFSDQASCEDSVIVESTAGDRYLKLKLGRLGACIRGTLSPGSGPLEHDPRKTVILAVQRGTTKPYRGLTVKESEFRICGLDPGLYDIAVVSGSLRGVRSVAVAEGEEALIDIGLELGVLLSMQYVGEQDEALILAYRDGVLDGVVGVTRGKISQCCVGIGILNLILCVKTADGDWRRLSESVIDSSKTSSVTLR